MQFQKILQIGKSKEYNEILIVHYMKHLQWRESYYLYIFGEKTLTPSQSSLKSKYE